MAMPGRNYNAGSEYRYGFNGKEKDNSTGEGNLDFGARILDVRLGRWFAVDQHFKSYVSPYEYAMNSPTNLLDPDGNTEYHFHYLYVQSQKTSIINGVTTQIPVFKVYTWVEAVENTGSNAPSPAMNFFYIHRDHKQEGKNFHFKAPTQFYPNINANCDGNPSTGITKTKHTTPLVALITIETNDDDLTSLYKILDDFPEMKTLGGGNYLTNIGGKDLQKDFWNIVFRKKKVHDAVAKQEKQVFNLMAGVVTTVLTEVAVGEAIAAFTNATLAAKGVQTTLHGAERVAGAAATRGGVLSVEGINTTKTLGKAFAQGDGATVFLHEVTPGRFNAVVQGNKGIITTMENWSQKSINRISKNYGWKLE